MKTIQEIAQWVIDNRYPKSENNKVSDAEMYHTLIEAMNQVLRQPTVVGRSEQLEPKEQICYKSNEPCKYDCSGLCKESC